MPGHSIAVVRALKSSLWATAGRKAGLKSAQTKTTILAGLKGGVRFRALVLDTNETNSVRSFQRATAQAQARLNTVQRRALRSLPLLKTSTNASDSVVAFRGI